MCASAFDLSVGTDGPAFATIDGGAHVTSNFVGVGRFNSGSVGTLTVSGAGTTLTDANNNMTIGDTPGATGTVSVLNGGTITTNYVDVSGGGSGSQGTLIVGAGGTFNVQNSSVGLDSPAAVLQMAGGILNINETTNNFDAINFNDPGSVITGFGTINGAIHGQGIINATGGTLTLGDPTRTDGIESFGTMIVNVGSNAILNLRDADFADIFGPVTLTNGVLITSHGYNIGGNTFSGYGVVVGNSDTGFQPITGTVNLSVGFDVGALTAHVYSLGPASFGPLTTIEGGTILAPSGLSLANGNAISGHGNIAANVSLASGVLSATGGSLNVLGVLSGYGITVGSVNSNAIASPSGTVDISTGLSVGNQTATVYSIGLAHLGGTTTLTTGGKIIATNGITLNGGDQISGVGAIASNVALVGGSLRGVGGTLAVTGTVSGFGITNSSVSATTFAAPVGNLTITSPINIGSDAATLRSQGSAAVTSSVTLAGGSVNSTSGIDLRSGGSIGGAGTIAGQLIADGGQVAPSGGSITFSGSVAIQGQTLNITGPAVNSGTINLVGTNSVLSGTQFTNSGTIAGHGTIFTSSGLTNSGSMQFSGVTDVLGNVTNTNSIVVTGGGPSTFYSAFNNTGNVQVDAGTSAVFLGFASGNGTYSGAGLKIFDGGGGSLGTLDSVVGSTLVTPGTSLSVQNFNEAAVTVQGMVKVVAGGTVVNKTAALSIAAGGQLDLADNDLIIDNTSGQTPVATVRGYLASAFNQGNWNGNGLASSSAHSNPKFQTALGFADNSVLGLSSFDGQAVNSHSIIVKYTYYGDANLDGTVNTADFQRFLDGFATGGSTWTQGDFTYDGKVDLGNDFNLFLESFLAHGGTLGELAPIVSGDDELTVAQKSQLLALVPEPTSVGLIATAGLLAMRRRRR